MPVETPYTDRPAAKIISPASAILLRRTRQARQGAQDGDRQDEEELWRDREVPEVDPLGNDREHRGRDQDQRCGIAHPQSPQRARHQDADHPHAHAAKEDRGREVRGRLGDASHGTHTADGPFGCTERSRIGQNAHQHEPDEKGGGRD